MNGRIENFLRIDHTGHQMAKIAFVGRPIGPAIDLFADSEKAQTPQALAACSCRRHPFDRAPAQRSSAQHHVHWLVSALRLLA
jgi:hypothetical protein